MRAKVWAEFELRALAQAQARHIEARDIEVAQAQVQASTKRAYAHTNNWIDLKN